MAVSALERGEHRRPSPTIVRALADALELEADERTEFFDALQRRGEELGDAASLPSEPSPLLGRDDELAIVRDQLTSPGVRLLTLLGAGGVGKTRLAVAAATELAARNAFVDGVCFVDLSAVRDPSMVLPSVARARRAPEVSGHALAETLKDFLLQRRQLLVLDNFEHVLPAATEVATLLADAPGLTVLVTSREPLRLRWERTLPLNPLAVPDPRHLPAIDRLALVPAVGLFLERTLGSANIRTDRGERTSGCGLVRSS